MKILGLDPGSTSTGYGLIDVSEDRFIRVVTYGTIPVVGAHFKDTETWLLTNALDWGVSVLGYENTSFFVSNKKASYNMPAEKILTIQVQGLIELVAEKLELSSMSFYPQTIKATIIGGKATKDRVRRALRVFLNLPNIHDRHATDAIATACTAAIKGYRAKWPIEGKQMDIPLEDVIAREKKKPKKKRIVPARDLTEEQLVEAVVDGRAVYEGNTVKGVIPK